MDKKFWLVIAGVVFLLMISISVYTATTDKEPTNSNSQVTYTGRSEHKTEFVKTVTLKEVEGNKAYFNEVLPNFLPGRVSDKGIDMNFYKSSKFKEGSKFKIIRIYTEDDKGDPIHIYRFQNYHEKTR